jgi:tetratricopeptide (TPR) repeat protein
LPFSTARKLASAQDEAIQMVERAIKLAPDWDQPHYLAGILLERMNSNAEAERYFKKAMELNPVYTLSHYELGKLLVDSSQLRPAAQQYEQAIKYDLGLTAA